MLKRIIIVVLVLICLITPISSYALVDGDVHYDVPELPANVNNYQYKLASYSAGWLRVFYSNYPIYSNSLNNRLSVNCPENENPLLYVFLLSSTSSHWTDTTVVVDDNCYINKTNGALYAGSQYWSNYCFVNSSGIVLFNGTEQIWQTYVDNDFQEEEINNTTYKTYENEFSDTLSRLDLIVVILLFVLGCGCALFVLYLLYRCIHNFMTY